MISKGESIIDYVCFPLKKNNTTKAVLLPLKKQQLSNF